MPMILTGGKRQRGFSLLESLIAIVVMSLGLLGMAGLQAVALRDNQTAYVRSIATQQAYDMAERMRANSAGVVAGDYDDLEGGIPTDPDCIDNTAAPFCTPEEVAVTDRLQWNSQNAALLPGGDGTVERLTGADADAFEITVSWTERVEGGNATRSFVTRVRP